MKNIRREASIIREEVADLECNSGHASPKQDEVCGAVYVDQSR